MSDRHLRVGTAQREHAVELLRNAAAEERITFDELDGRVTRALLAVTRADLASVLEDLVPAGELDAVLERDATVGSGPGFTFDDPLVLEQTGWSELYVTGPWEVPPFLEVHSSIGGVRLDFSRAVARAKVIDLVLVINHWGSTTIIVPEGWGVDTSLQAESSYVETIGVRTRGAKGMPRIMLRGRTSGTLTVRRTKDRDVRKAERHLAKGRPALPPPSA